MDGPESGQSLQMVKDVTIHCEDLPIFVESFIFGTVHVDPLRPSTLDALNCYFSYGFGFGQRLSPEINSSGASFLSASKFRRVSS